LDTPNGLAFDSLGNLYVANTAGYDIVKVTPGGAMSLFASLPGADEPVTLAFQPIPVLHGGCTNGTFQLTVSMPSPYYSTVVQASTNLVDWGNICTNTPPFTLTNFGAATSGAQLYRAWLGP